MNKKSEKSGLFGKKSTAEDKNINENVTPKADAELDAPIPQVRF